MLARFLFAQSRPRSPLRCGLRTHSPRHQTAAVRHDCRLLCPASSAHRSKSPRSVVVPRSRYFQIFRPQNRIHLLHPALEWRQADVDGIAAGHSSDGFSDPRRNLCGRLDDCKQKFTGANSKSKVKSISITHTSRLPISNASRSKVPPLSSPLDRSQLFVRAAIRRHICSDAF